MKHMWKYDKRRDRVYCLRRRCDVIKPKEIGEEIPPCRTDPNGWSIDPGLTDCTGFLYPNWWNKILNGWPSVNGLQVEKYDFYFKLRKNKKELKKIFGEREKSIND